MKEVIKIINDTLLDLRKEREDLKKKGESNNVIAKSEAIIELLALKIKIKEL